MRFNRFLIFRYATSLFFFTNLYWLLVSLANWTIAAMVPLFLLVVDSAIIIEQTKKYWQPTNQLTITKIGYWIQLSITICGIIFILLGKQAWFFPFMNAAGRSLLLGVLGVGSLICVYLERKAWLIENDRDKYLTYLQTFETKGGK
ncbi:MAG TPA: hypothetical protein H9829_04700 [Candidatus Tetragenococcus pullicola]|nr:hypothetical protein [Candidatus Tetragenococcus pullicola]